MNDDFLRSKIGSWLDVLDAELLALVEESKIEIISPDVLQELMAGSLLYIQLEANKENDKPQDKINELIHSRWRYVNTISDTLAKRKRFYSLGFPIHDCNSVDQNLDELLALISSAEEYVDWGVDQQCEFLVSLADWIFTHITVLEPQQDSPCFACWDRILSLWLQGFSPNEIVEDETVALYVVEPTLISQFIEDAFAYKLSWGINAIIAYIGATIEDTGNNLSVISSYFSAFYKYGVCSPISCFLLASGLESRKLAQRLSVHYVEDHLDLRNILLWVVTLTIEQLNEMGLTNDEINLIIAYRNSSLLLSGQLTKKYQEKDIVLDVSSEYLDSLSPNEVLLFVPQNDMSPKAFSIFTLFGEKIGSYEYEKPIPDLWKKYHRTLVTVKEINRDNKHVIITIRVL